MANSQQVMEAQRRKKQFAVDAFGGKCQICGYNKCINSLQFHHINGDKEYSPSYVIMRWSWKRAKVELDKCILVCANCHGEIHYQYRDTDLTRYIVPWITKTCPTCLKVFDTKDGDQKYCSHGCKQIGSRTIERPSKEVLAKLIQEKTFVELGRVYGLSDNGIRKWCKGYDLPYTKKGIEEYGSMA